jgi:hypothetical protein
MWFVHRKVVVLKPLKSSAYEFEAEITQDRTTVGKIAKLSCNLLLGDYKLNKDMVR